MDNHYLALTHTCVAVLGVIQHVCCGKSEHVCCGKFEPLDSAGWRQAGQL